MKTKPKTIDEYLATLSDDKRAALEKLRKTIKAVAPKAEECISYQLPAFRQDGVLVAFGATASHCALYPMSSSTVEAYKDELRDYDTSKGTIRFQADKPLPVALVRKVVKARIAENVSQRGESSSKTPGRDPPSSRMASKAKSTVEKPAKQRETALEAHPPDVSLTRQPGRASQELSSTARRRTRPSPRSCVSSIIR